MHDDSPTAAPSPVRDGGRVDLRRSSADGTTVTYEARWTTPRGQSLGTVEIGKGVDLAVEIAVASGNPPVWLLEFTRALVRTTAKSCEGDWPRRLSRWRKEPAGRTRA